MDANSVLRVLDALRAENLSAWLEGGWGVDALAGSQTREHEDLDLVIEMNQYPEVRRVLQLQGFDVIEDATPVHALLEDSAGNRIDLQPVHVRDGDAWRIHEDGSVEGVPDYPASDFTEGQVNGRPVPCISIKLQIRDHSSKSPDAIMVRDLLVLTRLKREQSPTTPT